MSQPNLREIIKSEYKKCIEDPIYFMKKYVKIQHPVRGTVSFELYPFQENTLRDFVDNQLNIVLKSRQMGISTLTAAYSLWLMTFHNDKNILCISITQETAKEIVTKVRFANDNLPTWLKVPCVEDNRLSLRLKNGSQIKAVSSAGTAGRSSALSLLIIDECAFIENVEEIWLSSQYTLSTGGRAIVLSCVTGNTYVFTDKGVKQIKDFIPNKGVVGDYKIPQYEILGKDNLRRGHFFKNSGKTDTLKIITKHAAIEGSHIHKIWAYKKEEDMFGWYMLKELKTGDYAAIQYGMNIWGNNDKVDWNPSQSKKIKNCFNINRLSTDICYFLGLYISEGSVFKVLNDDGKLIGGTVTITCGDKEIISTFDKLNLKYYTSDDLHYCVSNKNLIELLEYIGFDLSKTAHQKIIPPRLLEMSKKNVCALLRGIFDGDGTSGCGNIAVSSTSKELIDQISILLNNIGILSHTFFQSKEKMNSYEGKIKHNHDHHILEIYGKNAIKFYNEIGFNIVRKQNNKNKIKNVSRKSSYDVVPGSLELVQNLFDVSDLTLHELKKRVGITLNGIVNKKTKYKTKNISRDTVLIMYELFKNKLNTNEEKKWNEILSPNIYWAEIKDIKQSTSEVFDFSLPDNKNDNWCHSVIYNGILGHQTPNGVGNFFHKTWVEAEEGKNDFKTIRLPWHLHPERDQSWRDKQTELSGVKGAAQECDCSFATSGNQVVGADILEFYKQTYIKDPIEKRGTHQDLWIWDYPNYSKNYMVIADCARGDGGDYSAFHVIEIESLEQVAEYKGQLSTKDFGNLLVAVSTEYNNALLVVENNNQGWAVLQQVIDRNYPNTFYSASDLTIVDVERTYTNKLNRQDKKLIPGFSTTTKTRPLVISTLELFVRQKHVIIKSNRLLEELNVFIWNGSKAEAMKGYNDDLVMSLGIGLWVRETALKLRNEQIEYNRAMVSKITRKDSSIGITKDVRAHSPIDNHLKNWEFNAGGVQGGLNGGKKESLTWLL
jgi:hypothetical protein